MWPNPVQTAEIAFSTFHCFSLLRKPYTLFSALCQDLLHCWNYHVACKCRKSTRTQGALSFYNTGNKINHAHFSVAKNAYTIVVKKVFTSLCKWLAQFLKLLFRPVQSCGKDLLIETCVKVKICNHAHFGATSVWQIVILTLQESSLLATLK